MTRQQVTLPRNESGGLFSTRDAVANAERVGDYRARFVPNTIEAGAAERPPDHDEAAQSPLSIK